MPGLKRKSISSEPGSSIKRAKKQKRSPPPTKPFLSTGYIVDSDDDETIPQSAKEDGLSSKASGKSIPLTTPKTSSPPKPRPKVAEKLPHKQKKQKYHSPIRSSAASVSSTSEKSDGSEKSETESTSEADQLTPQTRNTTEDGSESASESVDSDETASETEESVGGQESIAEPVTTTSEKPAPPYKPPAGFEAASISSSSKIRDLFSEESLRGKQIWHITAPASVPITSIKEVPIQTVTTGDSILSYKDSEYGFIQGSSKDADGKILLVPSAKNDVYQAAGAAITQTLHLQEIVNFSTLLDKDGGEVGEAPRTSKTHVKETRQQPEGLRMRYRPLGDNSSSDGSDGSDDSDKVPLFKLPPVFSPAKTKPQTEPRPIEADLTTSPANDSVKSKEKLSSMKVKGDSQDTPKSSKKPTSKKGKSTNSDQTTADETQSMEPPHNEPVDKTPQQKPHKKKKERQSSGSKNTWEAEEARRILAMSKKAEKTTAPTSTKSEDIAMKGKQPEAAKPKRKKRKSEVTE